MAPLCPSLVLRSGPRALLSRLLADVDQLLATPEARLAALSAPIRVVVNSRALRLSLSALLVARRGALAGVEVLTLHTLARQVLARAGEVVPQGAPLLGVLVRREAASHPALRDALEHLDDGYHSVTEAVSDLLDAGFTDLSSAVECVEALPPAPMVDRGLAVLAVADSCRARLDSLGLGHAGSRLSRTAEWVARDPDGVLPGGAVLVVGFDDAPGVTLDLLEALLRHRGAVAYVDQPPDPGDRRRADLGVAFTRRLRERLGGVGAVEEAEPSEACVAEPAVFQAPGRQAEVREVARRLRTLLDGGVVPETITVVARDLGPYVVPLRRELGRLGVPYSGVGAAGPPDPVRRRVAALAELLGAGPDLPADRWLDAVGGARLEGPELRLGLRSLGCARLGDVAAVDLAAVIGAGGALPLPLRSGLGVGEDGEARSRRRVLSGDRLGQAVSLAATIVTRWRSMAEPRAWRDHADALRHLLAELGWRHEDAASHAARAAIDALSKDIPEDFVLSWDEVVLLAGRLLGGAGGDALGGRGGGVQLLGAMEARGRTPEHLFVVGLGRDVFPRGIHEDPLLPDALRRALRQVLPDLPVKTDGHDEERFIFAQLLASAPQVTLSWPFVDDDGKPRPPSPLVARLQLEGVVTAPHLDAIGIGLRPAAEHARLAGLHGGRAEHRDRLAVALDARQLAGTRPAGTVADARAAILAELDPDRSSFEGKRRLAALGPYLGMVGPAQLDADLRMGPLFVTTAEAVAGCGWQAFLTRCLRVEPAPDPLGGLPEIDRLLLGTVAHAALERVVRDGGGAVGGQLDALTREEGRLVAWPGVAALDTLLAEVAERVIDESGVPYPGFGTVLAALSRPYLDSARDADWSEGSVRVLAAEVEASARLTMSDGTEVIVRFKADRVDRSERGLVFTDYKTGKPVSSSSRADRARAELLGKLWAGERLQGAVYAAAAGEARGRYLFVSPSTPEHARVCQIEHEDAEALDALRHAVEVVVAAWRGGGLVPRLEDAKGAEPSRCGWCEVSSACLRGDSGTRGRLRRWALEGKGGGATERAAAALWRIAEPPGGDGEEVPS